MKYFLRKVLFFLSLPLVAIIIFLCLVTYVSKSYKIDNEIKALVMGDSHITYSINDNEINKPKIKNISTAAESYYFSYFKLDHLLANNSNIKKVYLGMGYHNFSNLFDKFTNGDRANFYGAQYFYVLPNKEKVRNISWNLCYTKSYIKNILVSGYKSITDKPSFVGDGFQYTTITDFPTEEQIDLRIDDQFYNKGKLRDFSSFNLFYLEKIIKMLEIKNVELIILKTPTVLSYSSKLPHSYIDKYNEFTQKHNLKVIDFKNLGLDEIKYFLPDGDHVNGKGSELVTKEFKKLLLK